jgi:NAD(P)-dependent dehydrogenase (short-subunit alcohol dehydrogenase family)
VAGRGPDGGVGGAVSVVIVTGGTFGIGRAITLGLAGRGHEVVAFGLESRQLSSVAGDAIPGLAAELAERGLKAELLEADVSSAADVTRVVAHAVARHGRVDALVNNAAIGPLGTVLETSEADFDRIVAVNLKGPYLMARAVLPHLIAQGGGRIVNVGSGAGYGKHNMAIYSATKAGLHGLTMAMAYDHFAHQVAVNLVIPGGGGMITGMSLGRAGGDSPEHVARVQAGAPGTVAGRPATGDDLARAVAFLLSPEADALSGTVIDVGCFANQGGPLRLPPTGSR